MLPASKKEILRDRAEMFAQVRSFFSKRSVMEVDCPALIAYPSLDTGVEAMEAGSFYLHTSPEYQMKKLLAQGMGDLYYLGHVYRKDEIGRLHHPEFTMVEWYRLFIDYEAIIQETCALIMLFLGELPIRKISYRDAFLHYADFDPFAEEDCSGAASRLGIDVQSDSWDRDTWLNLILSHAIEPHLGNGELTVLLDYPPSQAALSRCVEKNGLQVAERFEVYHQGVELANGFHELADADEQRRRFEIENEKRKGLGKDPYPLDESFLDALKKLPDCCGVSVGFDRLLFLRHRCATLSEAIQTPSILRV